jgi:hypothetical protein|tara:strand:+ start:4583 stop:4825 length:243 start_codon:yes stop_codon:yes gene_type:complete
MSKKDDLTKNDIVKLLTMFTVEISKLDEKLDELIDSVTIDDLPDELDVENRYGDDIPFPVETLAEMGKYLGKVPFFLGIT